VSIRKSVTPDYLICLDDRLKFKSLRRHLTKLGMTPERYRLKWNLPGDYPMVASYYAAQRSALAKNLGFGLREKSVAAVSASAAVEVIAPDPENVGVIEVVATKSVSVDTIEVATVEPTSAKPRQRPRARWSPPRRRSR
jgi:ROS/MUCR transcriptional regulator protein